MAVSIADQIAAGRHAAVVPPAARTPKQPDARLAINWPGERESYTPPRQQFQDQHERVATGRVRRLAGASRASVRLSRWCCRGWSGGSGAARQPAHSMIKMTDF